MADIAFPEDLIALETTAWEEIQAGRLTVDTATAVQARLTQGDCYGAGRCLAVTAGPVFKALVIHDAQGHSPSPMIIPECWEAQRRPPRTQCINQERGGFE